MRATDAELGRSIEVLEAITSRRGALTLEGPRLAMLYGRLVSVLVSSASYATAEADYRSEEKALVLAQYVSEACATLLHHVLRVPEADMQMLINAVLRDLRDLPKDQP